MSEQRLQFPVLVCDQDPAFLSVLASQVQASASVLSGENLVLISDANQLAVYTSASPKHVSAILFSPKAARQFGVDVVRTLMQVHPSVPFFYLMDTARNLEDLDVLKNLPVHQILHKPISLQRIVDEILRVSENIDPLKVLALASDNFDLVGTTSTLTSADLVPVLAKNYLSGLKSLFDVYVAIGTNKKLRYIKILRAGDVFSQDRVASYITKGVEHFYLPKKSHEAYLKYCAEVSAKLVEHNEVSASVKVEQVLNYGQEVLHFFRARGINQSLVNYADQFAEKAGILVQILNEDSGLCLQNFLNDVRLYDHAVSAAMVAALVADAMDFETTRSLKTVGVAALLHDVGLMNMNPKFKEEDTKILSASELIEFQQHPLISQAILKKLGGVDPMALDAVAQHHERRGGSGYPKNLEAGGISRLGEIIGISEEFVRIIHEQSLGMKGNPIERMRVEAFDGFSMDTVTAFLEVFV